MSMSKTRAYIILLAAFLFLSSCTGPGQSPAGASPSPSVSPTAEPGTASPSPTESAPPSASPGSESTPKVPADSDYEFVTETYQKGEVSIRYPQLTGLTDSETQSAVNEMIKECALRDMVYINSEEGNVNYELDYEVTFSRGGFLSIKFPGYSNTEGAAHPTSFFYTINIDMKNQSLIRLSDLVKIDEGFAGVFRKGAYRSEYDEISPEWKQALDEYLNETDSAGWVKNLKGSDVAGDENIDGVYSYFSEDSLVISVLVPHVLGDYTELAIDYKDLAPYKTGHPLWDVVGK